MFRTNDYVFYASGGVCRVSDIQTAPLDNMPKDRQYYVLTSLHDTNGVMYIPVDSDQVFLRRLLNRAEAEELIKKIPSVETIEEPNVKLLRAKYTEAMRTYRPEEWVRVIKTVSMRAELLAARNQRLSDSERAFSEDAKRHLCTELSIAMEMKKEDMECYINEHIQKMA